MSHSASQGCRANFMHERNMRAESYCPPATAMDPKDLQGTKRGLKNLYSAGRRQTNNQINKHSRPFNNPGSNCVGLLGSRYFLSKHCSVIQWRLAESSNMEPGCSGLTVKLNTAAPHNPAWFKGQEYLPHQLMISCPAGWRCRPTISSSATSSPPALNLSASGFFLVSQFFISGG